MDMRYAASTESFIEELYDRYKVPLLRAICRHIGNSNACEDVFQDVMVQIICKADLLKSLSTPKMEAYIFLIAHGVSCDHLKKKYRHSETSISEDILDSIPANDYLTSSPMDAFEKVEFSIIMDGIPKEDRLLLIGKYYLSLSTKELAALIGVSSVAVRSRVHRAKKKAFDHLREAGLNMEDFLNE